MTAGSVVSFPMILTEQTAGASSRSITATNKSNSLTYTVASSLVCSSPLAVITVVGLLDVLMFSISRVKVSLADHMHSGLSLALCLVVHQPHETGTNTYPGLHTPFCFFVKIDTREDADIHRAITCKYPSHNICTVVGEWHHVYFCLGLLFFDTLLPREGAARKVWRRCVSAGFCARLLLSCKKLHLVSYRTLAFFLSTGNKYLFLYQRQ